MQTPRFESRHGRQFAGHDRRGMQVLLFLAALLVVKFWISGSSRTITFSFVAYGLVLIGLFGFIFYAKQRSKQQNTRGLNLVSNARLTSQLHRWTPFRTGIRLGGVRIPRRIECEHFLIAGSPGAGKSVLIRGMLKQIRKRKETAIIIDPDCEYVREFYDEERGDAILNPLDLRCPFWTPWLEFRSEQYEIDVDAMVNSLVRGTVRNSSERFFRNSGRKVLSAVFSKITNHDDVRALADFMNRDLTNLHRDLEGTRAQSLFNPKAVPQASAIIGTAQEAVDAFYHLPNRDKTTREWSALEWSKQRRGWLFMPSTESGRAATTAIQGVWLDTLVRHLMDADIGSDRVWIIVDELAALGYQGRIAQLLARGRKRGLAVVVGFQNVSQIRAIYDHEMATTMISMPTTKLILRIDDPETAEWASRLIGGQQAD